jgi:hypothetical protein
MNRLRKRKVFNGWALMGKLYYVGYSVTSEGVILVSISLTQTIKRTKEYQTNLYSFM